MLTPSHMLKCYITNYFLKEFLMILKVVISGKKGCKIFIICTLNYEFLKYSYKKG